MQMLCYFFWKYTATRATMDQRNATAATSVAATAAASTEHAATEDEDEEEDEDTEDAATEDEDDEEDEDTEDADTEDEDDEEDEDTDTDSDSDSDFDADLDSDLDSEGCDRNPCRWLCTQLEKFGMAAVVNSVVDHVFVPFGEVSSGHTRMQPFVVFRVAAPAGGRVFGVYAFERQMMCLDIDSSEIAPQLRKQTQDLVWNVCWRRFGCNTGSPFVYQRVVNGVCRNTVDISHIGRDVKVVARALIGLQKKLNE